MQWKKRAMFINTPATSFGKPQNGDDQKIYCPRTPASSTESHFFNEILIVHLDFPKKNVFNGHLVVSGKSVSI